MARLPRPFAPGLPAHLVVRGNNRQALFRSEGDRIFFHRCLVEAATRSGIKVHAYVLMTNHVHLLATEECANSFGNAIQMLGRRYVSYFNYLHQRTGGLWEGRYRSCFVDSDRYFLACQRYIEENPVRANMVAIPEQYAWSNHRANLGLARDDLVSPHPVFLDLGAGEGRRAESYRAFFRMEKPAEELKKIRDCLNSGGALGDDAFCKRIEQLTRIKPRGV